MKRGNQIHLFFSLVLLVALSTPVAAEASSAVRTGLAVSLIEEQRIEGDLYAVAQKINISGVIAEDLVAAAGQVVINGAVEKDVFLAALKTEIHGVIGDDLRIISSDTTIAEAVEGDLLVIGGTVHILSTASVVGDVLLYAGDATIEGPIEGDLVGAVGTLRIDAPITGNVDVSVEQLSLGERAAVAGSVRYVSEQTLTQSLGATVTGEIVRNDPVLVDAKPTIRATLVPVLVLLFSILVWYLVSRRSLTMVVNQAVMKSVRPLILGFVTTIFLPLVFSLLLVSVIGTLVGIAFMFGYLSLIVVSLIGVPAVFGRLLMNIFNRPSQQVTLLSLVVGIIGVALCMLIPLIGPMVLLALMIVTFGAVIDVLIRGLRN